MRARSDYIVYPIYTQRRSRSHYAVYQRRVPASRLTAPCRHRLAASCGADRFPGNHRGNRSDRFPAGTTVDYRFILHRFTSNGRTNVQRQATDVAHSPVLPAVVGRRIVDNNGCYEPRSATRGILPPAAGDLWRPQYGWCARVDCDGVQLDGSSEQHRRVQLTGGTEHRRGENIQRNP
jgi:hypothetical protein